MDELTENTTNSGANDLESLDYLRGVKSSTCLLLPTTPSPHPLDFKHPLSEDMSEHPFLNINDDANVTQNDASAGDSSSSGDSNSVVQDPVSAQLINNISMLDYQTLSKTGDFIIGQTEDCKLNGNHVVNNKKLPDFVNWNWGIIRKVLLWIVLSGLIACLGAIIAMVVTIPKECNPNLPWYQGKVFYEVFPAKFQDSNNDGIGDLKGLSKKIDYVKDLGVSAIRLNYIYEASIYPEQYNNITSLIKIDKSIGSLDDFRDLVTEIHDRKMYLVLDLPVLSLAKHISSIELNHTVHIANETVASYTDPTSAAILFWAREKVDGFYLKDLENFVHDINFGRTIQIWKQMIGNDKIFIASEAAYKNAEGDNLNVLLSRIDLIDVHLELNNGINNLKDSINKVISGSLWEKPHYPWVHWNIGSVHNERVSVNQINNTLALTALELVLPGTVSLFYGDEIGLASHDKDDSANKHIRNLVSMSFLSNKSNTNTVLNDVSAMEPRFHFLDVIRNFTRLRLNTPTIYLRAIFKEGNVQKNIELRKTEENLVVIERWYPRRNTCVFVGNFGSASISTDLSTMFYGGTVVASTNASLVGQVLYFDKVTFPPNSAIILKLEK